ncbi:short-chain dehydrogenase [Carpediemonas membranifera]|uniref:3-oxoacyl-[acyl-carrier-protein] reductase n=1 Tax=Carpediemonas membranifera TaxID=201153 RepID=A0A8J6B4N4_9EUKA|nr:short-chain dehydrogenase [Carpediemonas membranifera]|eukprot:KAG9395613.1 short-chain dehydrogenase [Carpediemonas membranifera]
MSTCASLFNVKDKVAIITGASSGLGVQFAECLAQNGAKTVIMARRVEKLEEIAKNITADGGECFPIQCDVGELDDVKKAVAAIKEKYGRIDILVNNAGIAEFSTGVLDHTLEAWDRVMKCDLTAVFLMTRECAYVMKENNYGKIINIASVGGIQANNLQTSYHAAKAGVIGFTKTAANSLAEHGITVNAIGPGVFVSEMTDQVKDAPAMVQIRERTAMKRFGNPGELNGAMLYFATDASTYTTGQSIFVDGGLTCSL